MAKKKKKGFTILELLLYVCIVSVMVISISMFIQTMLSARIKSQTIAEVEQQGAEAMLQITQAIRNAESITVPASGTSGASLTVASYESGKNPTIINSASNTLQIKEGTSAAVQIISSRIVASELLFQNLSRTGSAGTIRVQFKLTHINPGNKNEFDYSRTFYGSASIRK